MSAITRGTIILAQLLIRQRHSRSHAIIRDDLFFVAIGRFDYSGSPQDVIRIANDFFSLDHSLLDAARVASEIRKLRDGQTRFVAASSTALCYVLKYAEDFYIGSIFQRLMIRE